MKKLFLVLIVLALAVTAVLPAFAQGRPGPTIVDTAIAANTSGPYAGQFDILIAALLAADPSIIATLSGPGQFTVFAPTDDAFAAAGITSLPPQNVLNAVLTYHVAPGRRAANAVTRMSQINTLNGQFIRVSGTVLTDANGRSMNIIVPDIAASNGIIHVIDNVLLPAESD
ncbi:MAG: fasciclin domain-containing protein [Anaerolineae bacterium]